MFHAEQMLVLSPWEYLTNNILSSFPTLPLNTNPVRLILKTIIELSVIPRVTVFMLIFTYLFLAQLILA